MASKMTITYVSDYKFVIITWHAEGLWFNSAEDRETFRIGIVGGATASFL